jgi:hypothetical protein
MARKKTEAVEKTVKVSTKTETKYTKDVILTAAQYKRYKDLLTVVLDDNKTYTLEEVDKALNKALTSKIK